MSNYILYEKETDQNYHQNGKEISIQECFKVLPEARGLFCNIFFVYAFFFNCEIDEGMEATVKVFINGEYDQEFNQYQFGSQENVDRQFSVYAPQATKTLTNFSILVKNRTIV